MKCLSRRRASVVPPRQDATGDTDRSNCHPSVMSKSEASDNSFAGLFHGTSACGFFDETRNRVSCACKRGRIMCAAYCAFSSIFEGTITSASTVHRGTFSFFAAIRRQASGSRMGFSSPMTSAGFTSSQKRSRLCSGKRRRTNPIFLLASAAAMSGMPSLKNR